MMWEALGTERLGPDFSSGRCRLDETAIVSVATQGAEDACGSPSLQIQAEARTNLPEVRKLLHLCKSAGCTRLTFPRETRARHLLRARACVLSKGDGRRKGISGGGAVLDVTSWRLETYTAGNGPQRQDAEHYSRHRPAERVPGDCCARCREDREAQPVMPWLPTDNGGDILSNGRSRRVADAEGDEEDKMLL